jgi:hypothetical protein
MVARTSICLRRLAGGRRSGIVGFSRFLANPRVTVEALLDGWGAELSQGCAGRHILAIQDTSEINFTTTRERSRGLGEIGKGSGRGVLLHAMLGLDAETGGILGLAAGRVWTRDGRVTVPHRHRPLSEKESQRWLSTAEAAKTVLARAQMVTEISDREGDIYEKWARLPELDFHILTRAMADRSIMEGGGKLSSAPLQLAGTALIALRARPGRPARTARLVTRFCPVTLKRPASLAKARVWTIEPSARARPPASKACKGRITSIVTGWPSFSLASSAIVAAMGCNTHCAKCRCASLTIGPVVAGAVRPGRMPMAMLIPSRAAASVSRVMDFDRSGERSWGFQSCIGAGPPAAATLTDSRISTLPRLPRNPRAIASRSVCGASGNGTIMLASGAPLCQGSCPLLYFSSISQVGGIGR